MSPNLPDIVEIVTLDVPQSRAWTLLTDEDFVPRWLGCMRYRRQVGHVFYMQQDPERRANDDIEGATHCEILELDEPGRFRFSWYLPGSPRTEVSFELEAEGEARCSVRFRHTGWDQFDPATIGPIHEALAGGWTGFVLPALVQLARE